MGKTIIKEFLYTQSSFVVFKNQLYVYSGNGRIYSKETVFIEEFVKDSSLYDKIKMSDFNEISVLSNYNSLDKSRISLINYYNDRRQRLKEDKIKLYRQLSSSDVESFYTFEIWLEIKGHRIRPGQFIQTIDYPDDIAIIFDDKKYSYLGRKKIPAPIEPRWEAYLVPKEDIDKIIGIKKFKDVNWIGTEKEDFYSGKEENIVLDLNAFDESIYQIFIQHESFTIKLPPFA